MCNCFFFALKVQDQCGVCPPILTALGDTASSPEILAALPDIELLSPGCELLKSLLFCATLDVVVVALMRFPRVSGYGTVSFVNMVISS